MKIFNVVKMTKRDVMNQKMRQKAKRAYTIRIPNNPIAKRMRAMKMCVQLQGQESCDESGESVDENIDDTFFQNAPIYIGKDKKRNGLGTPPLLEVVHEDIIW